MSKDRYTGYDDKFQNFLFIGILLILIELFITERRGAIADKIKLFES